ncbi:hypothetical protein VNI00_009696 [Paramarasmius palmivorus]|uniref:Glutamine amidotransferase domain-containing protein n=1 Tax=Paramarasmius palmivorus TaxID=297713 RepID=A0AAW0CM24_9AGAR
MPAVLSKHGDYTKIFHTLLSQTLPNHLELSVDGYDVVHKMEYPDDDKLKDYDCVMLTGSAANAYDPLEWTQKLIAYVARIADPATSPNPDIKLVGAPTGICFGHQIIAMALGGKCERTPGARWEVGPTPIKLTDLGKELFGVDDLNIQEMHRDYVPEVPPNFHLLGSTDITMNQGMVRFSGDEVPTGGEVDPTRIQIFTVQGHPEFTEPIVTEITRSRSEKGVMDRETYEDAMRRRDWRNDGLLIAQAMWRIIGVGVAGLDKDGQVPPPDRT